MGDNDTGGNVFPFQTPFIGLALGDGGTQTGIFARGGGFTKGGVLNMASITDGTSNTMAMGETLYESNNWFTWINGNGTIGSTTVPINWKITSQTAGAQANTDLVSLRSSQNWLSGFGFRSQHPGIVNFLFLDGRVQAIKESVNRNVYRGLSTRRIGEVIASDQY